MEFFVVCETCGEIARVYSEAHGFDEAASHERATGHRASVQYDDNDRQRRGG